MSLRRLTLAAGRELSLFEYRMKATYAGLLEGYPNARLNENRLRLLERRAAEAFPGSPVHLIPPVVSYPDTRPGAFGPVAELPFVACLAHFESGPVEPGHDAVSYRSALTVLWFQDDLDTALEDVPGLLALPWEELAADYEW
ncbi:hypothetical protein C7C46_16005 [Streptomyces tateyamensis]|uniref:Uncharacterized protein n=1 Tax=Streptomyces tateyamensis TaxID=565073 RepID=A0A2V4N3J3_9ACTN|nr:hypothetical protein [Streptomyces tateyamensis]PYC78605.1 hypothetical protein C7C46_16005 [Streptomyces tateyamensis]